MMNEVKRPKKPLIFYYVIAMVILLAINLFTVPWLAQRQVQEVDYGTFIQMAEDQDLGLVEVRRRKIKSSSPTRTRPPSIRPA